ncbi:hypothetical protein GGTG_02093 [Gaeumannomyces tritici R3-111a-1]|uniref:Uncharacterized protein n=1 Tax=Gaeumannomyces tritici (strain R3-111a-1) TaxID=644352 RepID=J3NLE4_GAET3|nr:hypothetical protein GGTG_02093 [Gaeumannomyces tritici R3-111a-1]EJT82119.1 hypothetical protein GGTG_02093 [Gaeumannomyces tritici R3-111a-1]
MSAAARSRHQLQHSPHSPHTPLLCDTRGRRVVIGMSTRVVVHGGTGLVPVSTATWDSRIPFVGGCPSPGTKARQACENGGSVLPVPVVPWLTRSRLVTDSHTRTGATTNTAGRVAAMGWLLWAGSVMSVPRAFVGAQRPGPVTACHHATRAAHPGRNKGQGRDTDRSKTAGRSFVYFTIAAERETCIIARELPKGKPPVFFQTPLPDIGPINSHGTIPSCCGQKIQGGILSDPALRSIVAATKPARPALEEDPPSGDPRADQTVKQARQAA